MHNYVKDSVNHVHISYNLISPRKQAAFTHIKKNAALGISNGYVCIVKYMMNRPLN